jgi:hypothetical protein
MLHPYTIVETPSPNNSYTVDHGRMLVFPITIEPGDDKLIISAHIAPGIQDHSMRAWVSSEIGGRSVADGTNAMWHPNRTPLETYRIYDRDLGDMPGLGAGVDPGAYYVCFLNLVNSRNAISFVLTDFE